MSEPFLAEVRIVGFNFAPRGWAFCDGKTLPINQNQSLFSLLGTTYGGDGRTVFALPDLRGRTPIHVGNGHSLGQHSGEETHPLSVQEMPQHQHVLMATSNAATTGEPSDSTVMAQASGNLYADFGTAIDMGSAAIGNVGSGQGHENMQPFLAVNFVIALQGLFPPRN